MAKINARKGMGLVINLGSVAASGYAGVELLRSLAKHSRLEVRTVAGRI